MSEEEIKKEFSKLREKLWDTKFRDFDVLEEMCDFVYQSSNVFDKRSPVTDFVYTNLLLSMNKCRNLGWKNHYYHYTKIFGIINDGKKTQRKGSIKKTQKKIRKNSRKK